MCNICCGGSTASAEPRLVAVPDASEAAAAGGLDAHEVARLQVQRGLPRDGLAVHEVAPGCAGLAAPCPQRSPPTPLADERQAAGLQHAQLAHDAVSASVEAHPTRARPELVPLDAERVAELERLGRRRERVGH